MLNERKKKKNITNTTDIPLDVKGCKDLYQSFDKYVEVEMLDGDNKYQAEGHGLQVKTLTTKTDTPSILLLFVVLVSHNVYINIINNRKKKKAAKKGTLVKSFPKVLTIQLKRFEFDFYKEAMVKINDRLEFPTELELTKYMPNDTQFDAPPIYSLYAFVSSSSFISFFPFASTNMNELERLTKKTPTHIPSSSFFLFID